LCFRIGLAPEICEWRFIDCLSVRFPIEKTAGGSARSYGQVL